MPESHDLGALLAAQDWPAAERLLRRLASAKTPAPETFYNLAKVLEAAGKPRQRAVWLKRAVAANPRYAKAWYELGRLALEGGALHQALSAFQRAADLDPRDPDAQRSLGRIALRLGLWDKAAACFARHNDPEAQLARYRIAAETRAPTKALRDDLLAHPQWRPMVLKTLTRTAKGAIPLRIT